MKKPFAPYEKTNKSNTSTSTQKRSMLLPHHMCAYEGCSLLRQLKMTTVKEGDVDSIYLYGDIDIETLMEQCTYSAQNEAIPGYVCKPLQSIYGAKQAGGKWVPFLIKD